MDIDVTRKLRPQKSPESPAQNPVTPAPPAQPSLPLTQPSAPARSSFPTSPVQPSASVAIPSEDHAHTIRFAPSSGVIDRSGHSPVEADPVTGWLIVIKGMGRGRSLPLGYGIHPVGRGEDQRVSVRFGDKKISRRSHLEVSYDGKGRTFYVSPGRGSTLGYLNNQPVLLPSPLRQGDRITLGDTELTFVPFCGESFDWQHSAE